MTLDMLLAASAALMVQSINSWSPRGSNAIDPGSIEGPLTGITAGKPVGTFSDPAFFASISALVLSSDASFLDRLFGWLR